MKDYTISQQFAIIGMDGLDSINKSTPKTAVLQGILAAQYAEDFLDKLEKNNIKQTVHNFAEPVKAIPKQNKKVLHELEKKMAETLLNDGSINLVPSLLSCDMDYETSGIQITDYRSKEILYNGIIEGLRAEILEDGELSWECLFLFWLMRETGCIHLIFSSLEQNVVKNRMIELSAENKIYQEILALEFHSNLVTLTTQLLKVKKQIFKNPLLQGFNLTFPFLERRSSIFIDMAVLGSNVKERRQATILYLKERGHQVEEVTRGQETILKIDNGYYCIFPITKMAVTPIQGINLLPVYE
jgi:hypothetical protein